jgi:hypothetical protein
MVMPGETPYAYPPPGPMVVGPRLAVFAPAPPRQDYTWSASVDALFLERNSGGSVPLGFSAYNSATNLPPNVPTDSLYSDDVAFPLVAGVRLEIARKFDNDITLSGVYWGLQQWSVGRSIYGDPAQETVLIYSPVLQLPGLVGGLDDSLGYTYTSSVQNAEINGTYRLNGKDPYWEFDLLGGARYFNFTDKLTMIGIDDFSNSSEQLEYKTTNNLVGGQVGLLVSHGWARYQWDLGLKFGMMANIYQQTGTDTAVNAPGFKPFSISNSGSDFSALFEVSLGARYRITENLWLRIAYQFYDITGLALAPRQLGSFGHGGNVALDGLSIGVQCTW